MYITNWNIYIHISKCVKATKLYITIFIVFTIFVVFLSIIVKFTILNGDLFINKSCTASWIVKILSLGKIWSRRHPHTYKNMKNMNYENLKISIVMKQMKWNIKRCCLPTSFSQLEIVLAPTRVCMTMQTWYLHKLLPYSRLKHFRSKEVIKYPNKINEMRRANVVPGIYWKVYLDIKFFAEISYVVSSRSFFHAWRMRMNK